LFFIADPLMNFERRLVGMETSLTSSTAASKRCLKCGAATWTPRGLGKPAS
jgi:hypothetical protein